MNFSEQQAAALFKAEHFPKTDFTEAGDRELVEWAIGQVEGVSNTMNVVYSAIVGRPEDNSATVRDVDLAGLMWMLAERLEAVKKALGMVNIYGR